MKSIPERILDIRWEADELTVLARQKRIWNTNQREVEDLIYVEQVMERIRLQMQQVFTVLRKR